MAETKKVIHKVVEKTGDDTFGEDYAFINTFENIVDEDTGCTLSQFLDNYLQFLQENVYTQVSDSEPVNSHVKIWIDTSITNQG